MVKSFRTAFEGQINEVESFLFEKASSIEVDEKVKERGVFLHFCFDGERKHWYQRGEIEAIKQGIIETFFEQCLSRRNLSKLALILVFPCCTSICVRFQT
ncbi:MAG: hypothetical protein WKF84_30320 [Pyrinomonadaceae bacterium]